MKKYSIRAASQKDMKVMGVDSPLYACRSWAIDYNGELAAVFGFTYTEKGVFGYSEISKDNDAPLMLKWKAIKDAFRIMSREENVFLSTCTGEHSGSKKMLSKLGMTKIKETPEVSVFLWQARSQ